VSDKKTILLIDDDPLICEMTEGVPLKLGYDVVVAATSEQGQVAFSCDPARFDLVMVDHILSDRNGADLAPDLLRVRPDIRIALYTGGPTQLDDVQSKGICAVIAKALSREEFRRELERIFSAR